jgi:hypothetical protein
LIVPGKTNVYADMHADLEFLTKMLDCRGFRTFRAQFAGLKVAFIEVELRKIAAGNWRSVQSKGSGFWRLPDERFDADK